MAAGAISVNILSNVREAVRGVDDVADAVEEAGDRLHDLTKDGDKATDRMEDDFRSVAKAADRASDELRDKFRTAYRDVRDTSDSTADAVVRSQRRMGERSQEVGQEIRQNLGEGIANAARGDFASLADTIGDTLGGAVASIGGIGTAAIGVAGALGIGAIIAAFQLTQAEADATKERVKAMYDDMIESGSRFLSADFIQKGIADIAGDQDKYNQALQISKDLNVEVTDVVRAMAGDQTAISDILDGQAGKRQAELDLIAKSGGSLEDQAIKVDGVNTKYAEQAELFNNLAGAQDSAAGRFEVAQGAQAAYFEDGRTQIQRTRDADQQRWEAFATAAEAAKGRASGEVVVPVSLQDNTDYYAFRQSVLNRLGTIRPVVQLGPGLGQIVGP